MPPAADGEPPIVEMEDAVRRLVHGVAQFGEDVDQLEDSVARLRNQVDHIAPPSVSTQRVSPQHVSTRRVRLLPFRSALSPESECHVCQELLSDKPRLWGCPQCRNAVCGQCFDAWRSSGVFPFCPVNCKKQ